MTPALVIAGAASGVGKTTFTVGLIAALRRRGLRVQPFKAGPDYLDPTYHNRAAGPEFPTRNLDTWLLPPAHLIELYRWAVQSADIALIEGVMGLYDGKNGQTEEGSTAALAKMLGAPVVVVINIGKMSRTAGAIALGLQKFDPAVQLAGFLLNGSGSPAHYEWSAQSVEAATGLPVLGWLPKNAEWALPERHLGLVPAGEGNEAARLDESLLKLTEQIEQSVRVDELIRLSRTAATPETWPGLAGSGLFPNIARPPVVRIGLAQDAAFGFYYQDNLALLRAWGAEIVPFSPLEDAQLPPDLAGLYIGGGFPEVFAARLTANRSMRDSIKEAARQGLRIYAECGGLMYLGRELVDFDRQTFPMTGLLPYRTLMQNKRVKLGYAEARSVSLAHPLLAPGETVRGHEFHWSLLEGEPDPAQAAYIIPAQGDRAEGFLQENLLASYLHLHFGSHPALAPRLIEWFRTGQPGTL